jgi:hypothetical protein
VIALKEWIYQNFIVLDQWANAFFFGGSADETMSSRCYRLNHIKAYRALEVIINAGFRPFQGPEHCRNAYIKEVRGRQLPHDFFDKAILMGIFPADPEVLGDEVKVGE